MQKARGDEAPSKQNQLQSLQKKTIPKEIIKFRLEKVKFNFGKNK
jgi:hypothetical protein